MQISEIKKLVGVTLIDQEISLGHLRSGNADKPFRIGLGTGTTAIWAIRRLGEVYTQGVLRHILCVATSSASQLEAQVQGLPISDLNDPRVDGQVDLAFDGADQVDPQANLIKGGGAAHAREKLVEATAGRFIVLVDEKKMVRRLGGNPQAQPGVNAGTCQCADGPNWDGNAFAIPVEVLSGAVRSVSKALISFGALVTIRESSGKIGAVISDNGLVILDAIFPEGLVPMTNTDPTALEMAIKLLPGVLDVGIFTCPVAAVYIGKQDGTVEIRNAPFDSVD
jgi:ribose 5-phosphate isomerase A